MKLIKKLFYALILVIIVCVLAITALMIFIDPNQLKPVITKEVMKRTGYKLVVDGDLSWSLYPVLGVRAQQMSLYNPGNKEPLLDLKNVSVATDVWKLMRGNKQALSGDVYIASSTIEKLHTQGIHVGISWQNNMLNLSPITIQLYQGNLLGDLSVSNLDKQPSWRWNANLNNIDLKTLLNDLKAQHSHFNIKGVLEFKMQGDSKGIKEKEFLGNLSGKTSFTVHQGAIEGVNLDFLIDSAGALINRQPLPMPPNQNETRFQNLSGSAVIKSGVANTQDLLLVSESLTTRGQGSVDLENARLDCQLQLTSLSSDKTRWTVPVTVSGQLDNPRIQLDVGALNTMIVKQQVKKVGEKVQEEVKKQMKNLPDEANKFIKSLTGN